MTLKDYLRTCVDLATNNGVLYNRNFFLIPRVFCKDGFSISIQCSDGSYCASELGVRTYGSDWVKAEWGFPSEAIDGKKYNAEQEDNTTETVGGYVDTDLLQELLDEHGGLDLEQTINELKNRCKADFHMKNYPESKKYLDYFTKES